MAMSPPVNLRDTPCTGWRSRRILHFLINLHIIPRPIFLSRHGQSEYNVLCKIGGDSNLSEMGIKYVLWAVERLVGDGLSEVLDLVVVVLGMPNV